MKRALLLLGALALSGCASNLEMSRPARFGAARETPSQYCQDLDAAHSRWEAVAVVAGVLGGVNGIAAVPIDGQTMRISLAASAVLAGAAAAGAVALEREAAAQWIRDCSESPTNTKPRRARR